MPRFNRTTLLIAAIPVILLIAVLMRPDQQVGGSGQPIVRVTVPTLSAVAKTGETLFNANCATCHGANAAGQEGIAPPLIHKIYEPGHHSDISFHRAAKYGVRAHHWRFGNMPPVPGITTSEVNKVIAYVRELQRANGIN